LIILSFAASFEQAAVLLSALPPLRLIETHIRQGTLTAPLSHAGWIAAAQGKASLFKFYTIFPLKSNINKPI
jgi:hypothetical protein